MPQYFHNDTRKCNTIYPNLDPRALEEGLGGAEMNPNIPRASEMLLPHLLKINQLH